MAYAALDASWQPRQAGSSTRISLPDQTLPPCTSWQGSCHLHGTYKQPAIQRQQRRRPAAAAESEYEAALLTLACLQNSLPNISSLCQWRHYGVVMYGLIMAAWGAQCR